jgi:uncharacterized protein involved in exopolysaccharide biosynthesis
MLMKQYDAARLDEAKEAAVIQVVESAIPPERKSAPKRVFIMLLFIIMGLLLGSVAGYISWYLEIAHHDERRARSMKNLKYALLGRQRQC